MGSIVHDADCEAEGLHVGYVLIGGICAAAAPLGVVVAALRNDCGRVLLHIDIENEGGCFFFVFAKIEFVAIAVYNPFCGELFKRFVAESEQSGIIRIQALCFVFRSITQRVTSAPTVVTEGIPTDTKLAAVAVIGNNAEVEVLAGYSGIDEVPAELRFVASAVEHRVVTGEDNGIVLSVIINVGAVVCALISLSCSVYVSVEAHGSVCIVVSGSECPCAAVSNVVHVRSNFACFYFFRIDKRHIYRTIAAVGDFEVVEIDVLIGVCNAENFFPLACSVIFTVHLCSSVYFCDCKVVLRCAEQIHSPAVACQTEVERISIYDAVAVSASIAI